MNTLTLDQPWPFAADLISVDGFRWHPELDNLLLLTVQTVTPPMVADLQGRGELALLASGPLVGLMARFGDGWGWMDTMGFRAPGQPIPEQLSPTQERLVFTVALAERSTGLVRHLSAFTVSGHFARCLTREVADRWVQQVDAAAAARMHAEYAAECPSQRKTLAASIARTRFGD